MKTTINLHQFRQAFIDMDRQDNFSYEGLGVLFNYLEEIEEDTGEELELDVIALCCDYQEMTYQDIAREYNVDLSDADEYLEDGDDAAYEEERKKVGLEYLQENTYVVGEVGDDSVIFQVF